MSENNVNCSGGCQCDGPGYCPVYGIRMTERLHNRCKTSEVWRENFKNFFSPESEEDQETKDRKAKEYKEMKKSEAVLDEVMSSVEKDGVTLDNYSEKMEGLGDLLANVFGKLGVTEEVVQKWAGIRGCGCTKRKEFLNKILPFRKKE